MNGSMMIENLPFLHSIIFQITAHIGDDRPERVFATCLVAIALSSIATGLVFGLLGVLRLGSLLSFFPRVTLVGCIGGARSQLGAADLQASARSSSSAGCKSPLVSTRSTTRGRSPRSCGR